MDYGLFNIKQFIMLDSGVANTSLTILATVAYHISGQGKALFNHIFQNFPREDTSDIQQTLKVSKTFFER